MSAPDAVPPTATHSVVDEHAIPNSDCEAPIVVVFQEVPPFVVTSSVPDRPTPVWIVEPTE